MNIRRAIVWASASQYFTLAVNFSITILLARILTPYDFGVSAIGLAVIGIAEALRELAGGTFLVRENELTNDKIRSTTTINILLTGVIAGAIVLLAGPLARFFDLPALAPYLHIAVVGFAAGAVLYPQQALLSRDMAFDRLAAVNAVGTIGGALAAISFALAGFGANSFALAGVITSMLGAMMATALGRGFSIYRPSVRQWRSVAAFGMHSSASAIVGRLAEALPLFIFGRLLGPAELAIGHRALLLCLVPERLISAVAGAVALPELSRLSREGGDVKRAYLVALANVTALHWPAMAMLALLAGPAVSLLLGSQWLDAIPLVTILSLALMAASPMVLQHSVLVATGGVHVLPRLVAAQTGLLAVALAATAGYGLRASALSMLLVMPLNALMSLVAVRSRLGFSAAEAGNALARSAAVTASSVAAPLVLVLQALPMTPLTTALLAAVLAVVGWIVGLRAFGHPLWAEIVRLAGAIRGACAQAK